LWKIWQIKREVEGSVSTCILNSNFRYDLQTSSLSAIQKHVGLGTTCIQLQYLQVKWNHRCEQKHDLTNEYLVPRMSLYLRKPELSIVGIHASYLLAGWSTKNLQAYHMTIRNTMAEE